MANELRFLGVPANAGASHKVMIATPCTEKPVATYALSLAATTYSLTNFGIPFEIYIHTGNCHVDDARNTMLRAFLETDCTDLFFIDADMGWRPEGVIRLLKHPGDIVAGVYCHRADGETYPFHPGEGVRSANEHGLFEMQKVPTGFMRVRRHVIQALYDREIAKERKFWWGKEKDEGRIPVTRIVERGFASELGLTNHVGSKADYHSGDYVLCLKAKELGFGIFVDVDLEFEHVGEKTWSGNLGSFLRNKQGIDTPLFESTAERLRDGDASPDVFAKLSVASQNPYGLQSAALAACYNMAKNAKGDILECGSGLSTLVMGLALKGTEHKVYALEHDLKWLRQTGKWLERYGVENVVLIYAPLHPHEEFDWYGVDSEDLPKSFDGVLIDGPVRAEASREGVFALMGDKIANASMWIVDDIDDPEQKALVEKYSGERIVVSVADVNAEGWPLKTALVIPRSERTQMAAAE